ncbi:hypothetical protein NX862_13090 [Rhodobacter sp. KR11]|uniref:hypothetical protein n=1 Tax=Rhodobacter sp. KR11 TaxID=2974588 RepID=UPI002221D697|nr:hypothetical protein [Rhodobacter sp. KR11]MCW1919692.1 hypothetical protein [Rhodobacter sp. KR11]
MITALLRIASLVVLATPGLAQDLAVTGGLGLGLTTEADPGARHRAGGWIEAGFGGGYVGLSYDAYQDSDLNDSEAYLGYAATLGLVEVNGGVTRDLMADRTSLDLSLAWPLGDFSTELALAHDPKAGSTDQSLTLAYARPVSEALTLTASLTLDREDGAFSQDWAIGANRTLGDSSALAGYLAWGSDEDPWLGVDLSWEVTLLGGGDL